MGQGLLLERLSLLAFLAPFLADRLQSGRWPSSPLALIVDSFLGLLILSFVFARRRARLRVERIDALRETLNQAIIHDLKNPMTSVMGAISVVLTGDIEKAGEKKLLGIALHSCRIQMELLETLVDTSRLEFGELRPRVKQIHAAALQESCLKELAGLAAHVGVILKGPAAKAPSRAFSADPEMIRRVLINLLQNAVKYTPKGGVVELANSDEKDAVVLEVRDNGIGISQAQISRLFQKYYRVESGEQSVRRGSGIGLYYSRLVVEAHGGTIDVVSRVGEGTVVKVRLPRSASKELIT